MTRQCHNCGSPYVESARKSGGQPRRWCSAYCKRRGGRDHVNSPPPPRWSPTGLNLLTTARFLLCEGQHVNSGVVIQRDVGPCFLCATCEVPIRMTSYRPGMIRLHGSRSDPGEAA